MTDEVPRARPSRRRAAELYLAVALVLALAPAVLLTLGWIGVQTGLSDWQGGVGLLASDWASRLALVGVATGSLALIVALLAGFGLYWRRALVVLAITALTLGMLMWSAARPGPSAAQVAGASLT